MSITSTLFYAVARSNWGWSRLRAGALVSVFLAVDLSFLSANLTKIADGGWFPAAIGAFLFVSMTTWKRGRQALGDYLKGVTLPIDTFMVDLAAIRPPRVKGTAVFMTSNPIGAPPVLLHQFKHNKMLHEQVLLLGITTAHEPEVLPENRITRMRNLGHGFHSVSASYGFVQTPSVAEVLDRCAERGLLVDRADTSFFLGRETLFVTDRKGMARWRKVLFTFMSRNARPANAFFRIPPIGLSSSAPKSSFDPRCGSPTRRRGRAPRETHARRANSRGVPRWLEEIKDVAEGVAHLVWGERATLALGLGDALISRVHERR